jgi:hypothetical protein
MQYRSQHPRPRPIMTQRFCAAAPAGGDYRLTTGCSGPSAARPAAEPGRYASVWEAARSYEH